MFKVEGIVITIRTTRVKINTLRFPTLFTYVPVFKLLQQRKVISLTFFTDWSFERKNTVFYV